MGFVEGEGCSCNETGVECDVDATEEVSTEVDEAVYIKDEIPEAKMFPPIKTEQEVRLLGVCEVVAEVMLLGHLLPQKGNCDIILNYFLLCVVFLVPYSFKIWIAILKGRDFL
jgi:hypothetical protein